MDSHTKTVQKDHEVVPVNSISLSKYSNRVELKTLLQRSDGGASLAGERVVVGGWVKSSRAVKKDSPPHPPPAVAAPPPSGDGNRTPGTANVSCAEIIQSKMNIFKKIIDVLSGGGRTYPVFNKPELTYQKTTPPPSFMLFFLINDGSSVHSLQVALDSDLSTLPATRLMALGTCIVAEGVLRHPAKISGKHNIELNVEKLLHVGTVDPENYPLSKKQLPLHMLRDYPHFRPRTTTVASVIRIHSALTLATHTFFQSNGYQHVQVPVIATSDGEGFGNAFRVTTLSGKTLSKEEGKRVEEKDEINLDAVKAAMEEKSKIIEHLKRTESNREALVAAVQDLKKISDLASQLEMRRKPKTGNLVKGNELDISKDFFCRETYLTVSGQFHLESYACALGKVYTLGPRFRSDKIDTGRHLAEMWNLETEMAFSELDDAMNCAEEFFKFLCRYILENQSEDMKFISKRVDNNITNRLQAVASSPLLRLSYSEAINLLQNATNKKFETKPKWGFALSAEHLSFIADETHKGPVIIYNHPKQVKPFYTRLNNDNKTVAAFDLIVPKVGVVISGSQNEERFELLNLRMGELGSGREQYEWYLDIRRNGTVKHSGFSLTMERMLLFATALPDVRDAVPFPRTWGKAIN